MFCNCIEDRFSDKHSCLNLYPCAVKFSQSVNFSLLIKICVRTWLYVGAPLTRKYLVKIFYTGICIVFRSVLAKTATHTTNVY